MVSVSQSEGISDFFSQENRTYLRQCIDNLLTRLDDDVVLPLQKALKVVTPSEVSDFRARLYDLISRIYDFNKPFVPSEDDLSILRRALLHRRQTYTAENEALQLKTSHADILKQLQNRLVPVETMMKTDWFSKGKPCRLPRLTDFLSIQEVYLLKREDLSPPPPEYDEKFGILLSPQQFLPRLALARLEGGLRGTSISLAFIDIDDLKSFNTQFGEFIVDKSVLPVFMRCLEAHVHSHGHAFRFGGDEYMLLLPNLGHDSAVANCADFQRKLPDLTFPGVSKSLSVSIGLCTSGPDSPLTDRELQQRATDAKQGAKKAGKNRIAWIDGDLLSNAEPIL